MLPRPTLPLARRSVRRLSAWGLLALASCGAADTAAPTEVAAEVTAPETELDPLDAAAQGATPLVTSPSVAEPSDGPSEPAPPRADPGPTSAAQEAGGAEESQDARLAELRAASEQARAAVAAHYGETTEALDTPLVVVELDELVAGLARDLEPQVRVQVAEEFVEQQTRTLSELMGGSMYARYNYTDDRLEICLETVDALAEAFEDPALASPEVLRAVLVHEWVHARDGRDHDLTGTIAALDSTDALQAWSAVLEGHAQHVARRICAERGWSEAFERYTASITAVPPSLDEPALRLVAQVTAETFGFAYLDGERFVAAVAADGGEEAVAALFERPPGGPVEVVRPEWYLDPASRPTSEVDVEAGLERFAELAIPEAFMANRVAIVPGQLRAGLAGIEPAIAERFLGAILTVRAQVGMLPSEPGAQRSAVLYEFESPGEALAGLIAQRAVLSLRDEQNSAEDALIRITEAVYTDLEFEGGVRGLCAEKLVETPMGELVGVTVMLVRGALMVEMSVADGPDDPDQLAGWARATLAAAHGERFEADPADDVAAEALEEQDDVDAEEVGPEEDPGQGNADAPQGAGSAPDVGGRS